MTQESQLETGKSGDLNSLKSQVSPSHVFDISLVRVQFSSLIFTV